MNQKLVQSLVQVIFSLSDEEREYLAQEIRKHSLTQEIAKIEQKLQDFEQKYQMQSEEFYRGFQAGELGDSIDFFEWNTYYEMLVNAKLKAEILKLPPGDRLALMAVIVESLRETGVPMPEGSQAIHRMRGLLKTDQPSPTDQEVAAMLEERRLEKYLP